MHFHDQLVVNPLFHLELNNRNQSDTIASGCKFELQKGSTPAAYNRKFTQQLVTVFNVCCQHKLDDCAAMVSVVNRLVPIHFVAVLFMLVCFGRVCGRFILLRF